MDNFRTASLACIISQVIWATSVHAQAADQPLAESATTAPIVVTGTRLESEIGNSPSPIEIIDRSDILESGAQSFEELVRDIPINQGSNLLADPTDGGPSARGRSNINLRGLGSDATLVLFNGRRMTLTQDDFVDTNLIPVNAVGRIDLVKESGSAIYGSDAVAGVVNFVTRQVDGFEFGASYQTTTSGGQEDYSIDAAFGLEGESGHLNIFVSYFDRTPLAGLERDFFVTAQSPIVVGNPGTFFPLEGSLAFSPLGDPDCAAAGGIPLPQGPSGGLALPGASFIGFCGSDVSDSTNLVPSQRRIQAFAEGAYSLGGLADLLDIEDVAFYSEFGFSWNRNSTTIFDIPTVNVGEAIVPADAPFNPFGVTVAFFGQPVGNNVEYRRNIYSFRTVTGLRADIDPDWSADIALVYGIDHQREIQPVALIDRFAAALRGEGGPGNDQYYNPFGSAILNPDDPILGRDLDVIRDFYSFDPATSTATVFTVDAQVTGRLFELPGGPIDIAFGGQFRRDSLQENDGSNANRGNQILLGGDAIFPLPKFVGGTGGESLSRAVDAVFAEVRLPIADGIDLRSAVRHEDYRTFDFASTDSQFSLNLRPFALFGDGDEDTLLFRATFGTGFKVPSIINSYPGQTREVGVETDITNPFSGPNCSGTGIFTPRRTAGIGNLGPEQVKSYTFGMVARPVRGLSLNLTQYNISFSDLIATQEAQAILLDVCQAANGNPANVNDPRVVVQNGQIVSVEEQIINAARLKTAGLDFGFDYSLPGTAIGDLGFGLNAAYVMTYDLQEFPEGPVIDANDSRNSSNFAEEIVDLRGNAHASWALDGHAAYLVARYVDGFRNDQPGVADIDSHLEIDIQYSYRFDWETQSLATTTVTIGAINLFNNEPPFGEGLPFGYVRQVHDPRGRMIYARLRQDF